MRNPLIPRNNYITRISEKLMEDKMRADMQAYIKLTGCDPKDLKLYHSDFIDRGKVVIAQKVFNELKKKSNNNGKR